MADDISQDSRFSHIAWDPQFKRVPKSERKVKIDKRFQSMFTSKKFSVKYTVDKRGRPINNTSKEDLKRYYDLSSGSESDGSEVPKTTHTSLRRKISNPVKSSHLSGSDNGVLKSDSVNDSIRGTKKSNVTKNVSFKSKESEEDSDGSSDSESSLEGQATKDSGLESEPAHARGEDSLSDSSLDDSSDSEDSLHHVDEDSFDHRWGELDCDAEPTKEETNRLAICNMDWDRIRAADLMVLFNSFVPAEGFIKSVTIYPSLFGLKKMEEEDRCGPEFLGASKKAEEDDENDVGSKEGEEGSSYNMESLRQYQLNRLKYYYAVVECDSPATANHLFNECDGLEYESSANRLDLRFVPTDTVFDQEPHETMKHVPQPNEYEVGQFVTTALQQAKVKLTWDETDPKREKIAQKLTSGKMEGISNEDLHAYLASSSGGEESEEEKGAPVTSNSGDGSEVAKNDPISTYRQLLKGIEEEKGKKDAGMEMSWSLDLKSKTDELVQKKKKEGSSGLTPFQQYLEKRKEKQKLRRKTSQQDKDKNSDSDDDIPSDIDMNDPYFKEEFQDFEQRKKKKEKHKNKKEESQDEESKQNKAELELLLMTDADDKKHFSLKSIQEQEGKVKSKRCKKGRKKKEVQETNQDTDNFEVDVKDDRFSALFTSHHFNIDPADPHYRKTKGLDALRAEKFTRRDAEEIPSKISRKSNPAIKDPELCRLVKSIKATHKQSHIKVKK